LAFFCQNIDTTVVRLSGRSAELCRTLQDIPVCLCPASEWDHRRGQEKLLVIILSGEQTRQDAE